MTATYSGKVAKGRSGKGTTKPQVRTYRDLLVWQKAMNLVTEIYTISRTFPKEETYGLTCQLRRCAVSVPSNIAEGYSRRSSLEYVRFLQIATGSLFELQTQSEIAMHLGYLPQAQFERLHDVSREIERMLSSLIRRITAREKN